MDDAALQRLLQVLSTPPATLEGFFAPNQEDAVLRRIIAKYLIAILASRFDCEAIHRHLCLIIHSQIILTEGRHRVQSHRSQPGHYILSLVSITSTTII